MVLELYYYSAPVIKPTLASDNMRRVRESLLRISIDHYGQLRNSAWERPSKGRVRLSGLGKVDRAIILEN